MDKFAEKMGLDDKNIFNAPVTIIDPRYDDDDIRLITTIFSPEKAAGYLNYIRQEWRQENEERKKEALLRQNKTKT